MKKLVWVAGLCSLGLVACGDSSSSPSKGQDYCKIVSSEPLVLETLEEGIYSKTSFDYSDERLVEKVEYEDQSVAKWACSSYKSDDDYGEVECNGKSIIAYSSDRLTNSQYKKLLNMFVSMCKEYDDPEDENSNSDPGDSNQLSESKSSSSAQGYQTGLSDYCEVVSENPFVMNMNFMGLPSTSRYSYSNGTVTVETEYENSAVVDSMCALEKNDYSYTNVRCKGNKITADFDETMSEREYTQLVKMFKESCINYKDWGNVETYFESSSSVVEVSSASDEANADGSISWYDKASYKKESVVASNAAELRCTETHEPENLSKYDVAYEFDDPEDLGRDYFGKNNAYIDDKVTPVEAECGSLVLNGSNGLLIPLSETFKSNGFVAEVRFMATAEGNMSNIFVAEPPGSGVDGWQIRLDGSILRFHYRDAKNDYDWHIEKVGEITLNEWHVVNISIGGTSGSSTLYVSISLDGDPRVDAITHGDISNIEYGLGIGYDSMYQGLHDQRFFIGKIDYIRYGKDSE
ncbi:hypothetical protein [Fibrobacter succinogenes]|uniref:hypothetical protein n=1 Tax=Fibrobacter succinogenes TaxID=833 RepID=UPI0013D05323|nr:hypothetical protein [Fibrobacter succinogenes]